MLAHGNLRSDRYRTLFGLFGELTGAQGFSLLARTAGENCTLRTGLYALKDEIEDSQYALWDGPA